MNPSANFPQNFCTFTDACKIRQEKYNQDKKLVLTNGCFDLLHAGHVYSLEKAAELGDELWVALNSNASIRSLKGKNRPIFSEYERAYMLSSLKFVSLIFIFENTHLAEEILQLKPDIYVKSGDYSLEKLNQKERISLEKVGAEIHFVPLLDGFSTTSIINTIRGDSKECPAPPTA
ncbi:MAG: adenylyltransferase/cytidyltransferase family protein [Opitutae bacterium]